MAFHSRYSTPTDQQYQAIGRVAANWCLVEFMLEEILARLACSPAYFGRALTNDLSPDNRYRALRNLCDIHEVQLCCRVVAREDIEQLRALGREFATKKQERNLIVHWVAMRSTDDEVAFAKFRSKPDRTQSGGKDDTFTIRTVAEINALANRINELYDRLEDVSDRLPNVPWP